MKHSVNAYSNNYNKSAPGDITASEWNTIDDDFLDKQGLGGDSMSGPLTLPGSPTSPMHAATKQYADANIFSGSPATDKDSNIISIVCDSTPIAGTVWNNYRPSGSHEGVYTVVDTRSSGGVSNFSSIPYYFISIGGNSMHFDHLGIAIYNPTDVGFTLVLKTVWTSTQTQGWAWYVNWCGIGQ